MCPEDREIESVGNGNGTNAGHSIYAGGPSKKFESEVIEALVDKIGDAINDIAAAAVRELTDMSSVGQDPFTRPGVRWEMSATAVALGSIAGGIIASMTSGRGAIEAIVIWCSVAVVNVAHLAYYYISLKFSPQKVSG